jgi:exonuclease III
MAGDFTFTLVTAHTKPDNNKKELEALEKYYRSIQNLDSDQKDVILLGDLNADCTYMPKNDVIALKKSKYTWVIDDDADTTIRNSTDCAYDRIIFTKATKEDYTGKYEVYQFDKEQGMTKQTALKVSDHYPVWAEFYTDKDTD